MTEGEPAKGAAERMIDSLRKKGMTPEQIQKHLQERREALRKPRTRAT